MSTHRIKPIDAPYDAPVADIFNRIMPPGMEPLHLFRTQARNPRILQKMFAGNLLDKGAITLRERELIILRTCARCKSEYEWGVHVALFAQRGGLDADTIAATLAEPLQHRVTGNDALLFDAVDELHDQADIGDASWKSLATVYSDEQILEIIALTGFYHSIAFIANAARVELEAFAARFADYAS